MQTCTRVDELRKHLDPLRLQKKSIGLVPTMGNLHEGHLALLAAAQSQCAVTVTTIFVNPLQFGPAEDLDSYPRTPEEDLRKLNEAGNHFLFMPTASEMRITAPGQDTRLHVPGLSDVYCGQSRPGHFDGVATIVCKLFNIVKPDTAYFGLKDYQQYLIVRKLAADLCLDVGIMGVETVREASGLALSSRNSYLSAAEREAAPLLYQSLKDTAAAIISGSRQFSELQARASGRLQDAGFQPEYLQVCNALTLSPASEQDTALAILAAAKLGKARLIDNICLNL